MKLPFDWKDWLADHRPQRAIAPLLEYLDGKSIAIVGNASSLIGHSFGELIDEHEIVVRMNLGFPINPRAQGRRFDLWCFSHYRVLCQVPEGFVAPRSVWMSPKFRENQAGIDCHFYPQSCWRTLYKRLGARPSVGAMTIDLVAQAQPRAVTVVGFDFKRTGTYYLRDNHIGPHDFQAEARHIMDLTARRSWRFIAT
ncbi:glycosyltransferase family 29 protein [Dongia deserti]|uniref:glycosyltransferase family 29 protein n=1 Tax=Dongia deserti TaxID=2268030 RepID=UPI000E6500D2|nr:glycosyltransferase family 29 protein [Dongia deserti]